MRLSFSSSKVLKISFQDCNKPPGWDYFDFQKDQLLVTTFEREYCINDGLFDETTTRAQLLSDLTSQLAATDLNISYAFVLSYPEQGDSTGLHIARQYNDGTMERVIEYKDDCYDSYVRQGLLNAALSQEVIWCPSIQKDNLQVCNVLSPLEISGGPISLGLKPVFPSLELYEDEDDSSIWERCPMTSGQ